MHIDEFIWLPNIVDKLAYKHKLYPEEVEEVFFNRPRFYFMEKGRVTGQDLYMALGQTDAGRYLSVFFIRKESKLALVISARDMDTKEHRRYGRK